MKDEKQIARKQTQYPDWETIPLTEGLAQLAMLWQEAERASAILNQRNSPGTQPVFCIMANSSKRPGHCLETMDPAKAAFSRVRTNPETLTFETIYCCSAICHAAYQMGVQNGEIAW